MKPLHRTARRNGAPLLGLDLNQVCDQCNKHRAHGNHQKCSKRRQELNKHKWVQP